MGTRSTASRRPARRAARTKPVGGGGTAASPLVPRIQQHRPHACRPRRRGGPLRNEGAKGIATRLRAPERLANITTPDESGEVIIAIGIHRGGVASPRKMIGVPVPAQVARRWRGMPFGGVENPAQWIRAGAHVGNIKEHRIVICHVGPRRPQLHAVGRAHGDLCEDRYALVPRPNRRPSRPKPCSVRTDGPTSPRREAGQRACAALGLGRDGPRHWLPSPHR